MRTRRPLISGTAAEGTLDAESAGRLLCRPPTERGSQWGPILSVALLTAGRGWPQASSKARPDNLPQLRPLGGCHLLLCWPVRLPHDQKDNCLKMASACWHSSPLGQVQAGARLPAAQ
jgi:hypothetical protein